MKPVEFSGRTVDWRGQAVAGAEVVGAEQLYDFAAGRIGWGASHRTITDGDGRFQLCVNAERRDSVWVVAWKKGLALGWQCLRNAGDGTDLAIRLDEPAVLAGTVIDEGGQGIAGATVRVCLKDSWAERSIGVPFDEPREWFTTRTDEQGRFRFERIPMGATADFWVEAPGRASGWTHWRKGWFDFRGSQFKAGRTDIRIVLPSEAILRGRVIDEDSGQGIPGVRLLARPDTAYANYSCVEPVTSGPDGAFVYLGVPADIYSLQVVAPQNRMADWVGRDVKVTAQVGRTVDVNIPVSKGGLIKVAIRDAATGRPIRNAGVSVSQAANFGRNFCWSQSAHTNAAGLARLRVPPGECTLRIRTQGYVSWADPERVVVAKGAVLRREVRLEACPVAVGTVRDPNGQPAAGVLVSSRPLCEEPARTDTRGQFQVTWRPGPSVRTVMVLARDPLRNLASVGEVPDPSKPVDISLEPAYVVRGRITDPNGRPIQAATVSFRPVMPAWITDAAPAVFTDANGVYEARAILAPTGVLSYGLEVCALGYGPARLRKLRFETAESMRVDVPPIVLPPVDKSISGLVVDANGGPAAGLAVLVSDASGLTMAGQPERRTVTDTQGRFLIEGVCAGPLRIQAGFPSSSGGWGTLQAQGGDQDVRIVLGREGVSVAIQSLLGKPLPDWKGLIDLDPEHSKGKPILLCFFDLNQRPSRSCLDVLAQQTEAFQRKGVIVAAIQASVTEEAAWRTWAQDHNGKFPLGQVRKDAEKVKAAWGVQSLPWLILTDKRHMVVVEGFSLDDLGKQIEAASGR